MQQLLEYSWCCSLLLSGRNSNGFQRSGQPLPSVALPYTHDCGLRGDDVYGQEHYALNISPAGQSITQWNSFRTIRDLLPLANLHSFTIRDPFAEYGIRLVPACLEAVTLLPNFH